MKSIWGQALVVLLFVSALLMLVVFSVRLIGSPPEAKPDYLRVGDQAVVRDSGMRVTLIARTNEYDVFVCRIDNGPGSAPRYQEFRFARDELRKIPKVEK